MLKLFIHHSSFVNHVQRLQRLERGTQWYISTLAKVVDFLLICLSNFLKSYDV